MAKKKIIAMGDTITWKGNVPLSLKGKRKGKHRIYYRCFCIPEREGRIYYTPAFPFYINLGAEDEVVAAELTRVWGKIGPFKLVCNKNKITFSSPRADHGFTYIHAFYVNRSRAVHLVPGQTVQIFPKLSVSSSYP